MFKLSRFVVGDLFRASATITRGESRISDPPQPDTSAGQPLSLTPRFFAEQGFEARWNHVRSHIFTFRCWRQVTNYSPPLAVGHRFGCLEAGKGVSTFTSGKSSLSLAIVSSITTCSK